MKITEKIKQVFGKKKPETETRIESAFLAGPENEDITLSILAITSFLGGERLHLEQQEIAALRRTLRVPPEQGGGGTSVDTDGERIALAIQGDAEEIIGTSILELASLNDEDVRLNIYRLVRSLIMNTSVGDPGIGDLACIAAFVAWQNDRVDLAIDGLAMAKGFGHESWLLTDLLKVVAIPGSAEDWRMERASS